MKTIIIQRDINCGDITCDSCQMLEKEGKCKLFNEYVETTPGCSHSIYYRLEQCINSEQGH